MNRDPSRRRALVAPIILLVVLAAMTGFQAVNHLTALRKSRALVEHSHAVIEAAQTLFSLVRDAETGQRGYQLSVDLPGAVGPDLAYLKPFTDAKPQMPAATAHLQALVADDPAQSARVAAWAATLKKRIDLISGRVELIREGKGAENMQFAPGKGRADMDEARRQMAEIIAAERSLLAQRSAAAERTERFNFIMALCVSALAMLGLGVAISGLYGANRRLIAEMRDREAAEAARREADALYRAIFEHAADYIFVVDVIGEGAYAIAEMNPAAEAIASASSDSVRGTDLRKLLPSKDANFLTGYYRRVIDTGRPVVSRDQVRIGSQRLVWESILVPLVGQDGRVERIVGSSRDVTERERAEEAARRSQRMEAIGHLTGGVAHDFNNLLQVVRGNLELAARDVPPGGEAAERLSNALKGADRAAQLTRQLLAFGRRQPLEPKVVNLGRLVEDMADMLRRTLGEAIAVETRVAPNLPNTLADPAQVESAILNLALNARDAMPDSGSLVIEIAEADLDEAGTGGEEPPAGRYVMLSVSDTGHGMSKETLAQVFEPFFTTKGEEKGTGLGLSMVYGFVKQSSGHIQIYSEPGAGTTVKIFLPQTERQAEQAPPEPDLGAEVRGAGQVVLVVEDEPLVRCATVGALKALGYDCLEAADGQAALAILEGDAKVDLLFTDLVMPGPVKSADLVRMAKARRPDLPVLFTSGYAEGAVLRQGQVEAGAQLLSKPFSREVLARKVNAALTRKPSVVLVVEDDALVRLSAIDMVEQIGCAALAAADGAEALAYLESDRRIDVLFTDIGLPDIRGPALAERALALRPDLKVVFASGYAEAASRREGVQAHLTKPYEQDELQSALLG